MEKCGIEGSLSRRIEISSQPNAAMDGFTQVTQLPQNNKQNGGKPLLKIFCLHNQKQ